MKYKSFVYPYLIWMVLLVIIPFLFMALLSFSKSTGLSFDSLEFSLENVKKISETVYYKAILNSLLYGGIATIICLLIGYPVAYVLAFSKFKYKTLALVLIIVPTWSNMLLRIIAWEKLFLPNSILNSIGISLDLIGTPLAVIIGMVSIYLPFMIFPIYTVLEKIDTSLIEASSDLGLTPFKTFLKVTLPLSTSGIISGIIMTFLPSATAFALPARLSGGKLQLIGNIIETQFKTSFNYNFGSLISLVVVIVILIMLSIIYRVDSKGETLL